MAIVSNALSARLRFADNNKTVASYSDVDPDVTANEVEAFANAVSSLRTTPVITKYLVVDTEISDDGQE